MVRFGWRGSGAGKPNGTHATRERHERNESPLSPRTDSRRSSSIGTEDHVGRSSVSGASGRTLICCDVLSCRVCCSFTATVHPFASALFAERLSGDVGYGLVRRKPAGDWRNHELNLSVLAYSRSNSNFPRVGKSAIFASDLTHSKWTRAFIRTLSA